ncbi:MAG: RluA family pseudouridine synthase [Thermodesulfovibrionales bacterium]|nr:RluA family pseudouridine synthase [Thermodesulfovibrionales bacterium]
MSSKDSTCVFQVTIDEANQRLDSFVSQKTQISRSQVQKLIQEGYIRVNSNFSYQNYKVKTNDTITIFDKEKPPITLQPEPIDIQILYKDNFLVVIDKPSGMVVYPSFGHDKGTLINAVFYHCKQLAQAGMPLRPGIVHRLDKDTSGVIVVALEDTTYYGLAEQFSNRSINRKYLSLIYGNPLNDSGEIDCPIGRSISDRKKMSVRTRKGKEAITRWKVIERYKMASLIEVKLGTGRTHQIRVHLSSIGHPVLGDTLYGKKTSIQRSQVKINIPRQMLHAETLGFVHPITNQYMEFSTPLPKDMRACIEWLKG